jgi:hypothetical protein
MQIGTLSHVGPGRSYNCYERFVCTSLFHWFTPTEGNLSGPWRPIEGRAAWTGGIDFWEEQLKQITAANIDAVYVHLIENFEAQRITFFQAYARLRARGWDLPLIAPCIDPFNLWRHAPIDVATQEGKDTYCSHLIRFYDQFFAANQGPGSEQALLQINGKLALCSWWIAGLLKNSEALLRSDIEQRLGAYFSGRDRCMGLGIYMIGTSLIEPDYGFVDERMVMFSGFAYCIHSVCNGVDVYHVQAGYWDQNIRQPGYLLPRDGGNNYRRAWDMVVANATSVHRVYIESWNEYDEGSGIYAADPTAPVVNERMHSNSDVFSHTGDPYEYIRTSANGAARFNGRVQWDARVLDCQLARSVEGDSDCIIILRNDGNQAWTTPDDVVVAVTLDGRVYRFPVPMPDDAVARAVGISRGRPVAVPLRLPTLTRGAPMPLHLERSGNAFATGLSLSLPAE